MRDEFQNDNSTTTFNTKVGFIFGCILALFFFSMGIVLLFQLLHPQELAQSILHDFNDLKNAFSKSLCLTIIMILIICACLCPLFLGIYFLIVFWKERHYRIEIAPQGIRINGISCYEGRYRLTHEEIFFKWEEIKKIGYTTNVSDHYKTSWTLVEKSLIIITKDDKKYFIHLNLFSSWKRIEKALSPHHKCECFGNDSKVLPRKSIEEIRQWLS